VESAASVSQAHAPLGNLKIIRQCSCASAARC